MCRKSLIAIITTICLFILPMVFVGTCLWAGDLDDGISKYTDESISKDDQMGQADTNINFIIVQAMSNAAAEKDRDKNISSDGSGGDTNINSVIVGPGANVKEIYNIIAN